MNITFRTARAQDAEVLRAVKIAAFSDEFDQFPYAEADDIFKTIVADSNASEPKENMFSLDWHKLFCSFGEYSQVILDDDKIIGCVSALPGKHSSCDYEGYDVSADDVNVILCIYVLPEYKNKGVGKTAMDYMEQLLPAKKWILDTPDVSGKNKRFYEKCGYKAGGKTGPNNLLRIFAKGF
jgi:Sortase and related acyltransferases